MKRLVITIFAAAALALSACTANTPANPAATSAGTAATTTAAPTKVTVGLTYIPNVQFSPFYLAVDEGDFSKAAVDATLRHHGANEGLFTALVAGQEDFVVAGGDELVQARAQGMDLVAVSAFYHRYPVELITKASGPIQTTKDLKGRSVGIPGRYGASWFGLLAALKDAGLTEADVKIVEIGYTQQAALMADKVDAVVGFSNNDAVQFKQAGVSVREVPLVSSGSVPLVATSLITTGAYAKANPDAVKAVVAATLAGVNRALTDPDAALAATAAQVPFGDDKAKESARATLLATTQIWQDAAGKVSGKLDPAAWAAMVAFMRSAGLITVDVDAAACFTNDFTG